MRCALLAGIIWLIAAAPASAQYDATVRANGSVVKMTGFSSIIRERAGVYRAKTTKNIDTCLHLVTIRYFPGDPTVQGATAAIHSQGNDVVIHTSKGGGTNADHGFNIATLCL